MASRAPARLRQPARLLRLASDERLVASLRAGDERAFEVLYDRHYRAILGFCRHMLGSREEAEDAVQHTFLGAYRDLVGSDKAIDLRPWLFAIARNRCLSLLRARREHATLELAEPATEGLSATVERREDLRELLHDLAQLPEDQRAALLLAEVGALDHAGIAAVLGCPREKVKALVFQARSSLIAGRDARATPCEQIRVELATATGAALRRGPLRRHLRACPGCRAFKAEVADQRRQLALLLPVAPGVALKAGVLSGIGGGGGAAMGAGGAGGGALGAFVSAGTAKVAVSLTVAGAVAGGGALALEGRQEPAPAPAHASSPPAVVPTADRSPASGAHTLPAADATPPVARRSPAAAPHREPRGGRPGGGGAHDPGGPSTNAAPTRPAHAAAPGPAPQTPAPEQDRRPAGDATGGGPPPHAGTRGPPSHADARGGPPPHAGSGDPPPHAGSGDGPPPDVGARGAPPSGGPPPQAGSRGSPPHAGSGDQPGGGPPSHVGSDSPRAGQGGPPAAPPSGPPGG